jgi:AcrR family transcriptional regulator
VTTKPGNSGRPRSERASKAILEAAYALLIERGFQGVSVEAIAERASTSKATIYRWWPNKAAVVTEAFLAAITPALPYPDTGSARDDVQAQVEALIRSVKTDSYGRVWADLVAESQRDAEVAEAFRSKFLAARRASAREVLERGVSRGEIRLDADLELGVDLIYGPVWFRVLTGHGTLDEPFATKLIDHAFNGLAADPGGS